MMKLGVAIAKRKIPSCVAYDPFQIKTVNDVIYILQHEIDLHEECQDGALTVREISKVRRAKAAVEELRRWLKGKA